MQSLDASLRLIAPRVPEALVPPDSLDAIGRLAARLAPIHCAGFEIRLDDENTDVDFAQRVQAYRGEPERLSHHIGATELSASAEWKRLQRFCDAWARTSSVIHRAAAGGWLEFDARIATAEVPIPSLFLTFEHRERRRVADELLDLVSEATLLLQGEPLSPTLVAAIARCVAACPPTAGPTDAGFMLSREIDALRLVWSPLTLDEAGDFLSRLEWEGTADELAAVRTALGDRTNDLVLSIDVGDRLFARVGFEYFPGALAEQVNEWKPLLDGLVDAGLCSPVKRSALLEWPGYTTPEEVDGDWPDAMIFDSLLGRPDEFSVLGRRLNHVKLVCEPGRRLRAKAYYGFGPLRLATSGSAAAPAARRSSVATGVTLADGIALLPPAMQAAADFLTLHRGKNGMWRDFASVMGGSDEWVTAYVGCSLAELGDQSSQRLAEQAWESLAGRREAVDGWGFNISLPIDADATAWALRLADLVGSASEPRARAAGNVLEAHFQSGGVRSYQDSVVPTLRGALGEADLAGLLSVHTCVTAAAAGVGAYGKQLAAYLRAAQRNDGRWVGYWWSDDELATTLAVEALASLGDPDDLPRLRSAARWASARIGADGAVWSRCLNGPSAFVTALCARILAIAADAEGETISPLGMSATTWLLSAQEANGSWPAAALMRIPESNAVDPESRPAATFVAIDESALFTTATVLTTLQRIVSTAQSPDVPLSVVSSTRPV